MARILSVLTLVLFHRVLHTSGKLVYAFLGDSVDLSPNCTEDRFSLIHSATPTAPDTVADRMNGGWTPGVRYGNRTEHSTTSSLFLLRVNYNDQGWYESKCGSSSSFIPAIKLRVFVASVCVSVNETINLPCHFLTADTTFDSITWERNGTLVLKLDVHSGESSYGTGFEGRVSVSPGWYSDGDLSLMLEDAGDYFCRVLHKEQTEGKVVDAVRLNVNTRRGQDRTTCTPPPKATEEKAQGNSIILYIIITAVVSVTVSSIFVWWLSSRCSIRGQTRPCDGQYSGVETVEMSPEVNGGPKSRNHEETRV